MNDIDWFYTSQRTCLLEVEFCDCDVMMDGTLATYCECHDCYTCGEINCAGHQP